MTSLMQERRPRQPLHALPYLLHPCSRRRECRKRGDGAAPTQRNYRVSGRKITNACPAPTVLMLLDEPFGALDPGISADMHKLILRLWEEHRMTIFMITHDIKEGFELGTRLLVFDKKRLDAQAPTAFGATITYDIPLKPGNRKVRKDVVEQTQRTEEFVRAAAL